MIDALSEGTSGSLEMMPIIGIGGSGISAGPAL
jgi:hypothetical protein